MGGYAVLVSAWVVQQSQHVAAIHLKKEGRAVQLSVWLDTEIPWILETHVEHIEQMLQVSPYLPRFG